MTLRVYMNGVERDATLEEEAAIIAQQAIDRAPPAIDLVAYAARRRWEKETGGIEVNGTVVDTSRESQAMITGAYAYSQANPGEIIKFKASSGWIDIDAATVAAIANAVGAHVQSCFAIEATVAAGIANETVTTTVQIDEAFAA